MARLAEEEYTKAMARAGMELPQAAVNYMKLLRETTGQTVIP
jgi:hypothetical protein